MSLKRSFKASGQIALDLTPELMGTTLKPRYE